MEIARGEATEKELDGLIRRRHDTRIRDEGHRPSEEMYAESVRVYNAARERQRRAEWAAYHRD